MNRIKWRWAPAALAWFLGVSVLWVHGWTIGLVLGSWHAWRGNFIIDMTYTDQNDDSPYVWKSAFMRRWFQTTDNGALPMWYIARVKDKGWSVKRALWDFCIIRNGFGGNPWNMRNFPDTDIAWAADTRSPRRLSERYAMMRRVGSLMTADGTPDYERERTWLWLITQSTEQPWKMGVWFLRKMRPAPKKPYRHFEIRHGFKFYPDREMADARFSVWDTGVRS